MCFVSGDVAICTVPYYFPKRSLPAEHIFCLFSLPTYYSGSLLDQIFFMAKKSSLKAALNSQQNRLKKNAKVQEAAQKQNLNALSKAKGKAKAKASPSHATVPFRVEDKILLIGEGNFSFSLALFKHPALQYLPPCNVTATSYDSELECEEKYPESKVIIEELRSRGVEVLFNVDATTLEKCKPLKGRKWDRIVWNFPHAGMFSSCGRITLPFSLARCMNRKRHHRPRSQHLIQPNAHPWFPAIRCTVLERWPRPYCCKTSKEEGCGRIRF